MLDRFRLLHDPLFRFLHMIPGWACTLSVTHTVRVYDKVSLDC